jgi:hypothetical protein
MVADHFPARTQEHQLTARLGQALESEFRSLEVLGYRFSVITQDIPDKGRGSLESRFGADLLISISLAGEFDKGLLIQSKWKDNRDPNLDTQCRQMLALSKSSYVWVYGPSGARTINARSLARSPDSIASRWAWNIGALMRRVLDCKAGDPALGVGLGPDRRAGLTRKLGELEAQAGLSMRILRPYEGEDPVNQRVLDPNGAAKKIVNKTHVSVRR